MLLVARPFGATRPCLLGNPTDDEACKSPLCPFLISSFEVVSSILPVPVRPATTIL